MSYVSLETSTSGILLEDILHLKAKGNDQELIKEYVTFGLVYRISTYITDALALRIPLFTLWPAFFDIKLLRLAVSASL